MNHDAAAAGTIAAVVGGIPSTVWAMLAGKDPLESTLAAGSMLLPRERNRLRLLAAAVPVHLTLSFGWAYVLERTLPRHREVAAGLVAGGAIAAVDLGIAARWFPRIRALPVVPQVADHVAYGATVGYVLARRRR
ncbi:MAG: hypothetical protein ACJ74M_02880 [Gaiellaceae bacterium]